MQKETTRYKWVLDVKELFNVAVDYFYAKKSAHYSRMLVVTELVVSGTQCIYFSGDLSRKSKNILMTRSIFEAEQ